jgi:hypothetical protein
MNKSIDVKALSIKELIDGTQTRVHTNDQIHFRTDEYLHELIRRCVKERGLSGEAEFFERLAKDYFSKRGWIPRIIKPTEKVDLTQTKPFKRKLKGKETGLGAYRRAEKIFNEQMKEYTGREPI